MAIIMVKKNVCRIEFQEEEEEEEEEEQNV
jgi:hypothetical protein